jgi:uncharacterized protein (TIGR00251 family)
LVIRVRVKPGSKREGVISLGDDLYEVRVRARPEKGKANERVVELLAEFFGVSKSRVSIRKGLASRNKVVVIDGTS